MTMVYTKFGIYKFDHGIYKWYIHNPTSIQKNETQTSMGS